MRGEESENTENKDKLRKKNVDLKRRKAGRREKKGEKRRGEKRRKRGKDLDKTRPRLRVRGRR